MYRVVIQMDSENAAKHLKNEIEKALPLIEGKVKIHKEPEIKPLNEVIEDMNRK